MTNDRLRASERAWLASRDRADLERLEAAQRRSREPSEVLKAERRAARQRLLCALRSRVADVCRAPVICPVCRKAIPEVVGTWLCCPMPGHRDEFDEYLNGGLGGYQMAPVAVPVTVMLDDSREPVPTAAIQCVLNAAHYHFRHQSEQFFEPRTIVVDADRARRVPLNAFPSLELPAFGSWLSVLQARTVAAVTPPDEAEAGSWAGYARGWFFRHAWESLPQEMHYDDPCNRPCEDRTLHGLFRCDLPQKHEGDCMPDPAGSHTVRRYEGIPRIFDEGAEIVAWDSF